MGLGAPSGCREFIKRMGAPGLGGEGGEGAAIVSNSNLIFVS